MIFADLVVSLCVIKNLDLRLKQLEEIGKKLRSGSDFIGENVSDEVLELKEKYDTKLIDDLDHADKMKMNKLIDSFADWVSNLDISDFKKSK